MANPHFLFFMFMLLIHAHIVYSSTCTLNFNQFPYEVPGECFDDVVISERYSCCHSSLKPVFQAMIIRSNVSRSIFLDSTQAHDCTTIFQDLHNKTNLSNCKFENFITTSSTSGCSRDVDSIVNMLGIETFSALKSSCSNLSMVSYSDDVCFSCVVPYRNALEGLRDGTRGKRGSSSERVCAEALLVSLASSDVGSEDWIQGLFSCLWDEINFPWPQQRHKHGSFMNSKKLIAVIVVVAALVIIAPLLYTLTRKRLQEASDKEIESLSVIVLKKALEDDTTTQFSCTGLYVFSPEEIGKATNYFSKANLIGEGSLGKMYLGIMPSGMRVAIKRLNEGVEVLGFVAEVSRMAKIRHPNLLSVLGYCERGDRCWVYEYCVNGDLAKWLLASDQRMPVLTWERRLQIAVGIGQGLWFLHNNPLEKLVHGRLKLTHIMLDERLEPKLSDFILSNQIPKWKNGLGNMANDVYEFGVVLLQLLTGRKNVDLNYSTRSLLTEAREIVQRGGNFSALVDPHLNGAYDGIAFRRILTVAVLCTNTMERDRPSMGEILQRLQGTSDLT